MKRFALFLMLVPALAQAQVVPGEWIVGWETETNAASRSIALSRAKANTVREFNFIHATGVRMDDAAAAQLRNRPGVRYVEHNVELRLADTTPNDPQFGDQWALKNTGQNGGTAGADIDAVRGWDIYAGDPNMKIGVIDTGIDYNHPDLAANIWTNPGEVPGNSIDDDSNGYVDDVHGYDFESEISGGLDGDPFDGYGHGTHVAGILAAVSNNSVGVSGVAWQAQLVAIKIFDRCGVSTAFDAIAALEYSIVVGCKFTTNSWIYCCSRAQPLEDAVAAAGAAGQLFVCAAGNFALDNDDSENIFVSPAADTLACIIAVASTDRNDALSSFSDWGATSVDLAAPGEAILSTLSSDHGGGYGLKSGTSMATPMVAGAVALVWGLYPSASADQVKAFVMDGTDPLSSLTGKCVTGGRLNLYNSLNGSVTNVPISEPQVGPATRKDGFYDVAGRRLSKPPTQGVYWEVKKGGARKVVVVK